MKPTNRLLIISLAVFFLSLKSDVNAQILYGVGNYYGAPGFDRGYQATLYCGNYPESWLRGSATLDKSTGVLSIYVGLETDAVHAGPRGRVLVYITDIYGQLLARISTAEVGRGGKTIGRAERTDLQTSLYLNQYIAMNAARITVVPECTGYINRWFNVPLQNIYDAAGNIISAAAYFF